MASASSNLTSAYPLAIAQAVLAGIVVCLDVPPLVWHIKHRNFAPVVLIIYILLLNFENFVNAIIWSTDDISHWFPGVGLCDVEAKFIVASSTAVPAATLCILRKLANVMDTKNITISQTKAQKRRAFIIEILLCIGIPILSMIFHFIVQAVRYYIVGISGCTPALSQTWLAIITIVIPPLVITLGDVYYASLIAFRLRKYRSKFDALLSASSTSKARFFRLFLLALTFIVGIFPLQLWLLIMNWPSDIVPFVWSEVHGSWWNTWIPLFPSDGAVAPDHWMQLASGFLVFIFLGLGQEAKEMYMSWATTIGLQNLVYTLSNKSSQLWSSSSLSFGRRSNTSSSSEKDAELGSISKMDSTTSSPGVEKGHMYPPRASDAIDQPIFGEHGLGDKGKRLGLVVGWLGRLKLLNGKVVGK
ncbi:STE3-domain-containing protein [Myriangium duriaei CBS 260.36]|uniref:STE3-domain-containing protein n=1 Tax=Myriangium duriaei CBS 260.36 TaxID=1168546 RepID=A0A9P4JFQ5_9PEZI|nr:STE3-domain-containing protein [Myriangium duriaei CBS 260.36]